MIKTKSFIFPRAPGDGLRIYIGEKYDDLKAIGKIPDGFKIDADIEIACLKPPFLAEHARAVESMDPTANQERFMASCERRYAEDEFQHGFAHWFDILAVYAMQHDVTLLCWEEDESICHRSIAKRLIEQRMAAKK